MKAGNKITAYKYIKNDELLRTDTLNTDTEKDNVVIYKNDKNGNQLATVNRYEIPSDKKDSTYVDIDVTLGDNRLNENVVNHYNALNQLTRTLTKNYKVSFVYDTEGLRTSKTVNGERTVFVWDGDQLVMELSEGGKVKKRYIRGNDLIYADRGADNTSKELSQKQYYVTDSHGNVVQLTDEAGNVIRTYEYDSFGNEIKPDSKDDNPFRYCGEYYDKETKEIYLRARYYQPDKGRFLTRDTYTGEEDEPLSLHLYTYCGNDGVNMIDPTGHWGLTDGRYVHQDITKEALLNLNYMYILKNKQYELLLEGSIYPDFLNEEPEEQINFGGESSNTRVSSYYKKYKNTKNKVKKIKKKYKINMKNKNMLHGKNTKRLKKLKKLLLKKLPKNIFNMKNEAFFMVGCVLHSIQDFSAHSFVSDLEQFRKKRNRANLNKIELAYHSDWAKRKNIDWKKHKKYKDNPYMDFSIQDGEWDKKTKRSENSRYRKAIGDTEEFLKKAIFNRVG